VRAREKKDCAGIARWQFVLPKTVLAMMEQSKASERSALGNYIPAWL